MVLWAAYVALESVLPSKYWLRAVIGAAIVFAIRTFVQGRKTTRERDLHARVILVTGAFTPLGLTLLQSLAERGAHIIAISPDPIDSPKVDILVSLIRSTTNNEEIFAEECDLTSAKSVRSLCTRFLTSENNRLDAMIFAHEYSHIGPIFSGKTSVLAEKERQTRSLATFLMITLLLPILLVAPSERDIRILNVVNPFYAAAVTSFSSKPDPLHDRKSIILQEGRRSLQTIILTRHLQRVLDSMPQGSHVPKTEESVVPVVSAKLQRSNIVSVSVSPGISRMGTIAPMLSASESDPLHFSYLGVVCYILLQPLLHIFTKSSTSTLQTILHALFLPTPFKSLQDGQALGSEILKPGSLYADCSVQTLERLPIVQDESNASKPDAKGKGKETKGDELPDDGELGGEVLGRQVWESFEQALIVWEKANPAEADPSPSPSADERSSGGSKKKS